MGKKQPYSGSLGRVLRHAKIRVYELFFAVYS